MCVRQTERKRRYLWGLKQDFARVAVAMQWVSMWRTREPREGWLSYQHGDRVSLTTNRETE